MVILLTLKHQKMPHLLYIGFHLQLLVKLVLLLRRYWQDKSTENFNTIEKNYSSTIEIDLPHKPGVLGHITSLIGLNKGNIVNLEIIKRKKEHLTFSIDLQIKDLKNFTNLISQIKQSNLRFKIIRHKQKKNAFIKRIFENFKRN